MKSFTKSKFVTTALLAAWIATPAFAQSNSNSPKDTKPASGKPSEAEMMAQMMEMGKPSEHHRILEGMVGTWTYKVKSWMTPDGSGPPMESTGKTVSKALMGGRYFTSEHSGKFEMPGPDGKMQSMDFNGISTEAYDNAKKKYVSTWIDNMSTGIMVMEGTFDPATKTLTYTGEYEPLPGMKTKARQTIKIVNHVERVMEMYETRGDKEVKVMEITYSRRS